MPNESEKPVGGGQQDVRPGPLRPEDGIPPKPEEIVCIAVDKVFDFCFREEVTTRTVTLSVPIATNVSCTLDTGAATCQIIGKPQYADGGLANVTLMITVPAAVEVGTQPMTVNFVSFKTIQLNMPSGTNIDCSVSGSCFCALVDLDGDGQSEEVFCQANLCVVLETTARVKLLVPSFGFCAPVLMRDVGPLGPPEFTDSQ